MHEAGISAGISDAVGTVTAGLFRSAMRDHPLGAEAAAIGTVADRHLRRRLAAEDLLRCTK